MQAVGTRSTIARWPRNSACRHIDCSHRKCPVPTPAYAQSKIWRATTFMRSGKFKREAHTAWRVVQWGDSWRDRKSTRLTPVTNAHLVCRLLLVQKNTMTTQTRKHPTSLDMHIVYTTISET